RPAASDDRNRFRKSAARPHAPSPPANRPCRRPDPSPSHPAAAESDALSKPCALASIDPHLQKADDLPGRSEAPLARTSPVPSAMLPVPTVHLPALSPLRSRALPQRTLNRGKRPLRRDIGSHHCMPNPVRQHKLHALLNRLLIVHHSFGDAR